MKSGHMYNLRSLVVGGAPTEKPALPDRSLEGLGCPEIQRIGWLNVVMAIDYQVRPGFLATSG
jgi:hypothetical protein